MTLTVKWKVCILLAFGLIIFALGCGLGWKLWGQNPPMMLLKPAPEIRQQDNSLLLKTAPDAQAKPKQMIPKGAKVERIIQVTVQSHPVTTGVTQEPPPQSSTTQSLPAIPATSEPLKTPCPPVTVDLTLVKLPDNSHRVIASSPNGTILDNSVDIPVEPFPEPPKSFNWAAGISYDIANHTGGVWLERKAWRLVLGIEAYQVKQTLVAGTPTTTAASVRVGWQF